MQFRMFMNEVGEKALDCDDFARRFESVLSLKCSQPRGGSSDGAGNKRKRSSSLRRPGDLVSIEASAVDILKPKKQLKGARGKKSGSESVAAKKVQKTQKAEKAESVHTELQQQHEESSSTSHQSVAQQSLAQQSVAQLKKSKREEGAKAKKVVKSRKTVKKMGSVADKDDSDDLDYDDAEDY